MTYETGPQATAAKFARLHAAAIHPDTSVTPEESPFMGAEATTESEQTDPNEQGMVSYTRLLGNTALETD